MGPIWGRQDPGGPHVGIMNFAIWDGFETMCPNPALRDMADLLKLLRHPPTYMYMPGVTSMSISALQPLRARVNVPLKAIKASDSGIGLAPNR